MNKIIRRIILIDDDSTTNFLNKMIIEKAELVDDIVAFDEPEKALHYFQNNDNQQPSLILLDINMPLMNGWEFLDQYSAIEKKSALDIIIMLTSSIDPEDKQKAEEFEIVAGYKSKPLSVEMLKQLINRYLT